MFICKIKYQIFTPGANDEIFKHQCNEILEFEEKTKTLNEAQRCFWDIFHKNKGPWHVYKFAEGYITDTKTGNTWKCDSYGRKEKGAQNMRKIDMSDVKEAGNFIRPTAGAYICKITDVEDIKDKEYLKVYYDFAEGDFKGYYEDLRASHPDWSWAGAYVKSYKQSALSLFKRFCSAVSKSNGNFVFDAGEQNAEEKTLVGKRIGLILQEEEYESNTGDIRTRLKVAREFPVDKLAEQTVPDIIRLPRNGSCDSSNSVFVPAGTDEELPFA